MADNEPNRIFLDGIALHLPAPPRIHLGRLMVPALAYLGALGAESDWHSNGQIVAYFAGRQVGFRVGEPAAFVDDEFTVLDTPPLIIDDLVYIPLRWLSEGLGAAVHYEEGTGHVYVQRPFAEAVAHLTVFDGPLNVRAGPSAGTAVLATLPAGSSVGLVVDQGAWAQVLLSDGRLGWLNTRYTQPGTLVWSLEVPRGLSHHPVYHLEVDGRCLGPFPLVDGRSLAPARPVATAAGWQASWADGTVYLRQGQKRIALFPGKQEARVDDRTAQLAVAPVVLGGQTMVPLAWLAEQIGGSLAWDNRRQTAILSTDGQAREPCVPKVDAPSYLVMEMRSGLVLGERDADWPVPIASVTKIMTAALALELGDPADLVTVSTRAAAQIGTTAHLQAGERLRLDDLLMAVMLQSANDAAVAVAEHLAPSEADFALQMTARAHSLGATRTTFANASGLDQSGHFSTARDLALITRHALNDVRMRRLVETREHYMPAPWGQRRLINLNRFLAVYPGASGVKSGWTPAAGHTLVAGARRSLVELIAVLLGGPDRDTNYAHAMDLMDYGFFVARQFWQLSRGRVAGALGRPPEPDGT